MLTFYNKHSKNYHFSQNGEEGILEECLRRLKLTNGHSVEIGSNNGVWLSNTAWLIKEKGWSGLMVEAEFDLWQESCVNWKDNSLVKSTCSYVSGDNINAFVTSNCVVLSIDVDGKDFEIFQALEAKPAVVIIEIDSSIPPDQDRFNKEGGAGYLPMVKLGIEKGYFLLCHTGNLVFIDKQYKKLFPEIKGDGIKNAAEYFNASWLPATA